MSSAGRRPPFYLGIDLGGTNIKSGVVDDLGQSLSSVSLETEADRGPEVGINNLAEAGRQAVAASGLTWDQIVGVGLGGTSDLCVALAKRAATRPLGSSCNDPEGAKLETQLSAAVNELGVGPQGLGGDSTAFAVHVELAATHITMNPVAVNMQCHSARRARATLTPSGIVYGF